MIVKQDISYILSSMGLESSSNLKPLHREILAMLWKDFQPSNVFYDDATDALYLIAALDATEKQRERERERESERDIYVYIYIYMVPPTQEPTSGIKVMASAVETPIFEELYCCWEV